MGWSNPELLPGGNVEKTDAAKPQDFLQLNMEKEAKQEFNTHSLELKHSLKPVSVRQKKKLNKVSFIRTKAGISPLRAPLDMMRYSTLIAAVPTRLRTRTTNHRSFSCPNLRSLRLGCKLDRTVIRGPKDFSGADVALDFSASDCSVFH